MRIFLLFFLFLGFSAEAARGKTGKKKKRAAPVSFRPATAAIEQENSPEFRLFLKRLQLLKSGRGKESLLIIGDSHNQCEDFGQSLAGYLRDSAGIPISGRNYAFPYPLARTSHRSRMQYQCRKSDWEGCRITSPAASCFWGVCGWLASSASDSLEFSWKPGEDAFRKGDGLGLFCPASSAASYRVFCEENGQFQEAIYQDSLSGFYFRINEDASGLRWKAVRRDTGEKFMVQGFFREPSQNGLSIGISGTNGARLDHYLLGPDFEKQLKSLQPGLIILALGTNDAFAADFDPEKTRQHLGLLLARIKMVLPESALLLAGPPDHCRSRGRPNPNTEKVNQLFSEAGESLEIPFWNQQKAMGGRGSILAWRRKKLATTDLVHFTPEGYAWQARLLGRSLRALLSP